MNHAPFFDRVLTEIEGGHIATGVMQLSGMLDGLTGSTETLASARVQLREHQLFTLLSHAPQSGAARTPSGATARRLSDATRSLTFIRASDERRRMMSERVAIAQRSGARVATLDQADDASAADDAPFDLICAPDLPDQLDKRALANLLSSIAARLANGGQFLIAPFLPDHLGFGWRRICLDQGFHCHTEADVRAAASLAGLALSTFRDATDSLMWSILTPATSSSSKGGSDASR